MNRSAKMYLGDRPYSRYEEYLEDLLIYIQLCLRDYAGSLTLHPGWGGSGANTAKMLEDIVSKLKAMKIDEDQDRKDWLMNIESRREVTGSMGVIYSIDNIVEKAEDGFILIVLCMSLLDALDRSYRHIFSLLCGDMQTKHPTLELCAKLYYMDTGYSPYKIRRLIGKHTGLLQIFYPELADNDNIMFCELKADDGLVDLLLDDTVIYIPELAAGRQAQNLHPLYFRDKELKQLLSLSEYEDYPVCLIYGNNGIGKKHLINHFCSKEGKIPVLFSIKEGCPNNAHDMELLIKRVRYKVRDCIIKNSPFVISGLELLNPEELDQLAAFLKSEVKQYLSHIFMLADCEKIASGLHDIFTMELADYSPPERYELWKYYSQGYSLDDINLNKLANTFVITPGQIIGALQQAALASENKKINERTLYKACYGQLNHKLAEKSVKVNASFSWDDLKIAPADKQILKDICNCVKNRHIVMNEWNFASKLPYGAGLTVLFAGPPGTGKTMAAQVIANELAMELYKIDVSQIFDKYVGETEKNIRQIFEQARKSNSILFFDEADAIFNKRIEASSSNDRFANIESSMLLQCVEEYSGISILATNNFNVMDPAFIRRFKYYILFREPDENVRYEIWKTVIPKEAPVSEDVDLKLLARQFEFTGAVIKNVVLHAAYLAAEKRQAISMIDILVAIKREMFKNNLILTKEKLGSLGYLFEDI